MNTIAIGTQPTPDEYHAIETLGRVRFFAGACIALRSGPGGCSDCVTACPVGAMQTTSAGNTVSAACIGCGACAAACPSGALSVKGFENPSPLPGGNIVRVECRKVPSSVAGDNALRVPCLGGISPSEWLVLVETAGNRRVIVVDRGWCAHCSAGSCSKPEHPARHALDQADAILGEAGWPEIRRPRIQHDALPASLMPTEIPTERPESLGRRAFFRRIGGEAQRAVGLSEPIEIPTPRLMKQHGLPLPERERLLAAAQRLAMAAGTTMPAAPFAALSIAPNCNHLGICAGVCPTGALLLYEDDANAGLEFNAWRCIGCGQCVKACPEHAISIHAAPQAPDPQVLQPLTAHAAETCPACQEVFYAPPETKTCPTCLRNRQMGASLFGTLLAVSKS